MASDDGTSSNLAIFCREVRNLLRSKPNCMIPFSKFVPAYHNHYGRQCCVYQFGFTKLIELLEAIPHVVQILGDGSTTNRYITLTHREQIKRFASDLIKVVKSQPGKKLRLCQFAQAYELVLGRVFRVEDYGTNDINVLLAEIWEGTINIIPISRESLLLEQSQSAGNISSDEAFADEVASEVASEDVQDNSLSSNGGRGRARGQGKPSDGCTLRPLFVNVPLPRNNPILEQLVAANELVHKPYITDQHPDCWFEIPRRERSDKEIKRTKYFIWDCIELLSKMKQNRFAVPFSKFIPAYHYYFNRQCKVSIFGFSKLIDLFESISPSVVEIIDQGPGEEKLIRLARKYWPKKQGGGGGNGRMSSSTITTRRSQRRQAGDYVIMSSSAPPFGQQPNEKRQRRTSFDAAESVDRAQELSQVQEENSLETGKEDGEFRDESDVDCEEPDGDEHFYLNDGSQQDLSRQSEPIDCGPTAEELEELEDELKAYEELQAIQRKRSGRMAAILDILKYSIY